MKTQDNLIFQTQNLEEMSMVKLSGVIWDNHLVWKEYIEHM